VSRDTTTYPLTKDENRIRRSLLRTWLEARPPFDVSFYHYHGGSRAKKNAAPIRLPDKCRAEALRRAGVR
jgi:hypothetical protein